MIPFYRKFYTLPILLLAIFLQTLFFQNKKMKTSSKRTNVFSCAPSVLAVYYIGNCGILCSTRNCQLCFLLPFFKYNDELGKSQYGHSSPSGGAKKRKQSPITDVPFPLKKKVLLALLVYSPPSEVVLILFFKNIQMI